LNLGRVMLQKLGYKATILNLTNKLECSYFINCD
jgi:hypothetical protein